MKKTSTKNNASVGTGEANEHQLEKSQVQEMGLSYDEVKEGLKRLLPTLELISKLTTSKYDDAAVAFLKNLLGE